MDEHQRTHRINHAHRHCRLHCEMGNIGPGRKGRYKRIVDRLYQQHNQQNAVNYVDGARLLSALTASQQKVHEAQPCEVTGGFRAECGQTEWTGNRRNYAPERGQRHRANQHHLLPVARSIFVQQPDGERGIGEADRRMPPKADEGKHCFHQRAPSGQMTTRMV